VATFPGARQSGSVSMVAGCYARGVRIPRRSTPLRKNVQRIVSGRDGRDFRPRTGFAGI
jgi:hypothetical protein